METLVQRLDAIIERIDRLICPEIVDRAPANTRHTA